MLGKRLETFISNILAILLAFLFSYTLRFGWTSDDSFHNINDALVLSYLLFCYVAVFLFYHGSDLSGHGIVFKLIKDAFINTFLFAGLFAIIVYSAHITDSIPRLFFIYFYSFFYGFSILITGSIEMIYRSIRSHNKRQTVIFTDRKDKQAVIKNLVKNGADDIEIIGVAAIDSMDRRTYYRVKVDRPNTLTAKAAAAGLTVDDPDSVIYRLEKDKTDPMTFLVRHNVDLAVISVDHLDRERMDKIIDMIGEMGVDSMVTLDSFALETFDSKLEDFGQMEVVRFAPRIFSEGALLVKRIMDIIGGLIGCLFTLIIGIFVAPAIVIEDGFPIFFKQKRVGKNGKYFYMYKFRSMYNDAEERRKELIKAGKNEVGGAMFKMKNDPRITKVGKFIRKTSLDEFPQFFNVLKGDMSLVGTRPPMLDEYAQYSRHHKRRLSLKPGITGMWQVSGRSQITDFEEVVRLDCYYIDHWSVGLDIKILFKTIAAVISRKGSE